jgi:flagellar basal-body rod protein FlgB
VLFDTTQLALERSISGAAQRQQSLAANIANASTPGYQRVDVDFHSALNAAMGASDPDKALAGASFQTTADRSIGPVAADGSGIDIDAESAKLAQNTLDQETAVQVLHTRLAILRAAMGVSS